MKELIERARGNPKTTAAGVVALAMWGGGEKLQSMGIEPHGSALVVLAWVIAAVALTLAKDGKKPGDE